MKYLAVLLLFFALPVIHAVPLPSSTTYYVSLAWNAPLVSTDPVAGYDMYRSVSGQNQFSVLNQSPTVLTSYNDFAILYGISYDYRVTSVDASGVQSDPSNTITLAIPFVPYTPVLGIIK